MMTHRFGATISAAVAIAIAATPATLVTRAAAQQPADLVRLAVQAMGGEQALRSVTAFSWEYHYAQFGVGQSELPESPLRATVSYGRAMQDYRTTRRAFQQENRLLTGAVQRQRLVVDGNIGMNQIDGQSNPLAPAGVEAQLRLLRLTPDRLLLAALDQPGSLSPAPQRSLRGLPHDGVRIGGSDTVSVWFDRTTGLPVLVELVSDDPVLGDRATQWWLTRWQPSGPILWPRQWDQVVNGQLVQHLYVTAAAANPALPDTMFAIPAEVRGRAQPAGTPTPPITVTMAQLAPNVWRAEGGTHHTLVVDQGDQLVLVEAPLSTQRVRAVLDTLRSRFPGKRVGLAVMTHYHWDHSGGIREIVAEGIPIVTLEANAAFVRQVASARRTLAPDLQAQRRRNPTLRTFTDSLVIGGGPGMVVLYRTPTVHAEGLLSAWVPSARVLFTSDVLNPAATLAPAGSAELLALARSRGLAPEKYAGGHGTLQAWADVERAARN